MSYKLMAVDIDGTLLDSSSRLTEGTKKAIRLGVESGLVFTISSGRPIQGIKPLVDEIGLDLPLITYNGAMVLTGQSREIIYEQKLGAEDAECIIELGKKFDTTVMVWKDNKLYASRLDERAYKYSSLSKTAPLLIEDVHEAVKDGVTKILWFDEIETINKFQQEVGKYLSGNVNYHTSQPIFLEFVDKNASKAIAMERLGQYFNIDRSEMIAIGDGFNDLSMIEYAGLGVAMANARDEIKNKANFITLSNDEDGVAHVIYKFILNK